MVAKNIVPEDEKKAAEALLTRYCESVPERVRDRVRLFYRWRGPTVTIIESRVYFRDKSNWIEHPVAQFRYDMATILWTLYYRDRNCRWYMYLDTEPARNLALLLSEVESDPTGIFWG